MAARHRAATPSTAVASRASCCYVARLARPRWMQLPFSFSKCFLSDGMWNKQIWKMVCLVCEKADSHGLIMAQCDLTSRAFLYWCDSEVEAALQTSCFLLNLRQSLSRDRTGCVSQLRACWLVLLTTRLTSQKLWCGTLVNTRTRESKWIHTERELWSFWPSNPPSGRKNCSEPRKLILTCRLTAGVIK